MKNLIFAVVAFSFVSLFAQAEAEKTFTPIMKCETPNANGGPNYVYAEIGQLSLVDEMANDPVTTFGIQVSVYVQSTGQLAVVLNAIAQQPKPALFNGKGFSLLNTSGNNWTLRMRQGKKVKVASLLCSK